MRTAKDIADQLRRAAEWVEAHGLDQNGLVVVSVYGVGSFSVQVEAPAMRRLAPESQFDMDGHAGAWIGDVELRCYEPAMKAEAQC